MVREVYATKSETLWRTSVNGVIVFASRGLPVPLDQILAEIEKVKTRPASTNANDSAVQLSEEFVTIGTGRGTNVHQWSYPKGLFAAETINALESLWQKPGNVVDHSPAWLQVIPIKEQSSKGQKLEKDQAAKILPHLFRPFRWGMFSGGPRMDHSRFDLGDNLAVTSDAPLVIDLLGKTWKIMLVANPLAPKGNPGTGIILPSSNSQLPPN